MRVGIVYLSFALTLACQSSPVPSDVVKPRTIVSTDGEVDDYDSMIRLLLYANEMDIQAIVYSASQWHWAGDGKGSLLFPENRAEKGGMAPPQFDAPRESHRWIGTDWIPDLIDAYGDCLPSLREHDPSYPSAEYLHSILKIGNVRVEGDMSLPTEGSEAIKAILLDDRPEPVYFQAWGGTNTLSRALLSIEEEYKGSADWDAVYQKVCDKLFLYIIQDQDGTYVSYISRSWPDVKTVYNASQFISFAYLWRPTVPQPFQQTLSGRWFRENIVENHGPLAARYLGLGIPYPFEDPEDAFGRPETVGRMPGADFNDFISEGDSPSYFFLFDFFGLRSLSHPEWGGMGGRFNEVRQGFWKDPEPAEGFRPFAPQAGPDGDQLNRAAGDFNPFTGKVDMMYPQTRWVEVLQNDFAARADWCVKPYAQANHAPGASVKGGLDRRARAGEKLVLEGYTSDPDGDAVSLCWWQYREAGTSDAALCLEGADSPSVTFTIPADAKPGETFHLILEAKDSGTPVLRHFQRVIVTVK